MISTLKYSIPRGRDCHIRLSLSINEYYGGNPDFWLLRLTGNRSIYLSRNWIGPMVSDANFITNNGKEILVGEDYEMVSS